MPPAPHRWIPEPEPLPAGASLYAVLRELLRGVRYARIDLEPVGLRRMTSHFLRCCRHLETFRDWYGNAGNPALQEALAARPSLVNCVVHPYLNTHWAAERKLAVISEHYAMLHGRLGFLRFAPDTAIPLADLGQGLHILLDKPGRFEHEGELTINLYQDELRLYSLVFTLGHGATRRIAQIGGLQGTSSAVALETYRSLTHRLHGLRPRDLLISAFRLWCQCLGGMRILAVSDARRVSSSAYFKSSAQVHTSYDEAWIENGGVLAEDGFFELPAELGRRSAADVPTRKRASYRRRYMLLDDLALQIDQSLRLARTPQAVAGPAPKAAAGLPCGDAPT